jgi:hypothetical protein
VNEDAITSVISLVAAVIGLATAILSALAARPRPATQPEAAAAQPQRAAQPPVGAQSPQYPQQSPYAQPPPYAQQRPYAPNPPGTPARALKISRSVWLGISGLVLVAAVWAAPLLCYCCVLPGIWIAVHDLRSPGTRRLAGLGIALCGLGFAVALTDSVIYFSTLSAHG